MNAKNFNQGNDFIAATFEAYKLESSGLILIAIGVIVLVVTLGFFVTQMVFPNLEATIKSAYLGYALIASLLVISCGKIDLIRSDKLFVERVSNGL